eukprot:8513898-Pyramimonas_sp.AAC.1
MALNISRLDISLLGGSSKDTTRSLSTRTAAKVAPPSSFKAPTLGMIDVDVSAASVTGPGPDAETSASSSSDGGRMKL